MTGVLTSVMIDGGVPAVMLSSTVTPWLVRRVRRRAFIREAHRAIEAILNGDEPPAPGAEHAGDLAEDDAGERQD